MMDNVTDLRKGERFRALEAIDCAFGSTEVTLVDAGLGGIQLAHSQPLRIGTRARFAFRRGEITFSIQGQVVWSRLAQASDGLLYKSGIQLDGGDVQYAIALNNLLRAGVMVADKDSLEKKRQRELEKERKRLGNPPTIH